MSHYHLNYAILCCIVNIGYYKNFVAKRKSFFVVPFESSPELAFIVPGNQRSAYPRGLLVYRSHIASEGDLGTTAKEALGKSLWKSVFLQQGAHE